MRSSRCPPFAPSPFDRPPCRRPFSIGRCPLFSSANRAAAASSPPRQRNLLMKITSEEHTSELQSRPHLVCRLLPEQKQPRPPPAPPPPPRPPPHHHPPRP